MKKKLLLLLVTLVVAITFTHAQSKKDLEKDYAACIGTRDSIQEVFTGLSADYESLVKENDSINGAYTVYDTMYNVLKEKVFNYYFDPADMSALIDSLISSRESAFSGLSNSLNDSISVLKTENSELKAAIETLKTEDADKTDVVGDLKQLKELLDSNIITQQEFDDKKVKLLEKL